MKRLSLAGTALSSEPNGSFDPIINASIKNLESEREEREKICDFYNIQTIENSRTIEELVKEIPVSKLTSAVLIRGNSDWNQDHPDPTFFDYWKLYQNNRQRDYDKYLEDLKNGGLPDPEQTPQRDPRETISAVKIPENGVWFDVRNCKLNEEGGQRIQIKSPDESKNIFDHSWNFDYRLVDVKIAKFNGDFYVYEGGGCCMKAVLLGINKLPASLVKVDTVKELRDLFYKSNDERMPIKGVELFKKRLVEREPFALLQNKIMERGKVIPIKKHPNEDLTFCDLGPLRKCLEGLFDDPTAIVGISGDKVKYVKDINNQNWQFMNAPNVVSALEIHTTVYKNGRNSKPVPIHSSLIVALCQFVAVFGKILTSKDIENMLISYRDERIRIGLKELGFDFKDNTQKANLKTPREVSSALNLTRMQTEKSWGVVQLGKLWNNYAKSNIRIQDTFLLSLLYYVPSSGAKPRNRLVEYDPSKDYSL